MRIIIKPVSILMAMLMVINLFSIVPISANAATTYDSGMVGAITESPYTYKP